MITNCPGEHQHSWISRNCNFHAKTKMWIILGFILVPLICQQKSKAVYTQYSPQKRAISHLLRNNPTEWLLNNTHIEFIAFKVIPLMHGSVPLDGVANHQSLMYQVVVSTGFSLMHCSCGKKASFSGSIFITACLGQGQESQGSTDKGKQLHV